MSISSLNSVQVEIKSTKYTVPFPKTGQFLEIISMQNRLSANLVKGDPNTQYAHLLAEMISCYSVLIPELKTNLNVETISDLDMIYAKELLESYTSIYRPFFHEGMNIVMGNGIATP